MHDNFCLVGVKELTYQIYMVYISIWANLKIKVSLFNFFTSNKTIKIVLRSSFLSQILPLRNFITESCYKFAFNQFKNKLFSSLNKFKDCFASFSLKI